MDCTPSVLALRYRSGLFQPLRGFHIELAALGSNPRRGVNPLTVFETAALHCATSGRWPFGLAFDSVRPLCHLSLNRQTLSPAVRRCAARFKPSSLTETAISVDVLTLVQARSCRSDGCRRTGGSPGSP